MQISIVLDIQQGGFIMYELYHGSNRLVWALYSVRDNKRVIKALAHIFKHKLPRFRY